MKGFKVIQPEGTFMLWIDYWDTGIKESELKDLMIYKAKVAFSMGSGFGKEGDGFFRINVAQPKKLSREAMNRCKNSMNL